MVRKRRPTPYGTPLASPPASMPNSWSSRPSSTSPSARLSASPRRPRELGWRLTDSGLAEEIARKGCELARQSGASTAVAVAGEGDAAEILIDTAQARKADLIVVGSKGITSASRFVLGSVANTVSHHAPCDVLIVHTAP